MQISRLFQIIYILLEKKFTTARELAEHFEVSIRTIYRDIDALCEAGIPIYASQGKGGGIALVDKFVLNKSVLSEKDQDEILIALQSLSAVRYPQIDDILTKLSSFFKKSNVNWIEVDFSSWGSDDRHKEYFSLLKNAILEQRVITFTYFGVANEKSDRRVEPLKLLFKDKSWYLQGYCVQIMGFRTFKMTRMTNIHITDEFCIHTDVQEFTPTTTEAVREQIHLKLKISLEGAYRVYDDFQEDNITKNEDGSYTVIVSMPRGEWIYNYLFSFGTSLEVIEPQTLREEVANRLNKMANKYHLKT